MAAECWAHAMGVAAVVSGGPLAPNPLGTCFMCHVFGCSEHAERDVGEGKWLCFTSISAMAAASAGIGVSSEEFLIPSHEEFEVRFPVLAGATRSERDAARSQLSQHRATVLRQVRNIDLLADAVGTAHALLGITVAKPALATAGEVLDFEENQTVVDLRVLFPEPFATFLGDIR